MTEQQRIIDRLKAVLESLEDIDKLLETKINRMVKQAIVMELSTTKLDPVPAHNGQAWDGRDRVKLSSAFEAFIDYQSRYFQRSPSAVRIKLLRQIRQDYAVDWNIANKG